MISSVSLVIVPITTFGRKLKLSLPPLFLYAVGEQHALSHSPPRFPHPRSQFAHPLHAGCFTRGRPPPPPRPPPLTTYRLSDGRRPQPPVARADAAERRAGRRAGLRGWRHAAEAGAHTSPPVWSGRARSLLLPRFFQKGVFLPKTEERERPTDRSPKGGSRSSPPSRTHLNAGSRAIRIGRGRRKVKTKGTSPPA